MAATTGDVTINGFAITQKTERDRTLFRRDQVIVFQFFQPDSPLTVLENITLPQEPAGVSQRKAAVIKLVSLLEKKWAWPTVVDKAPAENNNGSLFPERWRIIVMLVLAEPTGNLDSDTGDKVLDHST